MSELQELMQQREQEIAALKAKGRAMQDDFSHLDGVGPKISETLRSVGVKPIAEFSAEEVDEIREAQVARTRRPVKLNDPTTWPEQAGMAEEGKRETLNTLQDGLKEMLRKERPSTQESPEIETTTVVADA